MTWRQEILGLRKYRVSNRLVLSEGIVLTRVETNVGCAEQGIERVVDDIADRAAWDRLLEPGCTVVNLAYPQSGTIQDAVEATLKMVDACADARVALHDGHHSPHKLHQADTPSDDAITHDQVGFIVHNRVY